MVPNLRFIGLCDRSTLRRVRLCLKTPIKLYRPDLSAKIAIDLLILLNTVIGGDPYSKEVQLVPSKAMHASAPKLTCLIK